MPRILPLVLALLVAPSLAAAEPAPGTRFQLDIESLPPPGATASASNPPRIVPRPVNIGLTVPAGFSARLFAEGLSHARNLMALPNGDLLLAESGEGRITLLRDADGDGRAETIGEFAQGLRRPHGLALDGDSVLVADTERIWRFAYRPGGLRAGERAAVTPPGALGDGGGHWTRSLALHPDGGRLLVGIGSRGNIAEEEEPRATIREFRLDDQGKAAAARTFAAGLRNPVGMAFRPGSTELWTVVNERDGLGDGLVPDFLTMVADGGFYGWPYSYLGNLPQPGYAERAPGKVAVARRPDVLFQAHSAPLGLAFWRGDAYVALHGSWNRSTPAGYFVARVPFSNGRPLGWYEVFAAGFIVETGDGGRAMAWGRPVGLAVGADNALYVSDDAGQTVWRIARTAPD